MEKESVDEVLRKGPPNYDSSDAENGKKLGELRVGVTQITSYCQIQNVAGNVKRAVSGIILLHLIPVIYLLVSI